MKMGTVFRGIGRSDISALINEAIIFFANAKGKDIPLWEFSRRFEGDADKFMMDRLLTTLEAMKYVVIVRRPGADTVIHTLGDPMQGIVEA